jgi:hypothetical protein
MPLNDNDFDRLFRDRFRNHSSPVRGDLWRRIHTGLGTPVRHLHHLRYWRYLGGGVATVSVALAANLIFTPKHPTNPQLNHYSKISAPTKRHSDSVALNLTSTPDRNQPAVSTPDNPVRSPHNPAPSPHNPAPSPHNPASAVAKPERPAPSHPEASAPVNLAATRDKPANPNYPANQGSKPANQGSKSVNQGSKSVNQGSIPANSSANATSSPILAPPHTHYPIILPAIARLTAPPAISTRRTIPTHTRTLAGKLQPPVTLHPLAPFHPFKYISVYGSPDFPGKDYNFSWTVGARITFRFARHWSFTTGFQYEQLNVPTADVGGLTTMPFHFSDYSIPILAGYTTNFFHCNLTVTGGVLYNVYARAVGSFINRGIGVPVEENGHTLFLGADLERPINNRWAVFVQPYFRQEIFDGEIYIPSRTITNGILLGGRYHL